MPSFDEQKRLYDHQCKEILAEKYIQANILKACALEFKMLSIEEIATRCIEGDPAVATVPVVPSSIPTKVSGLNQEKDTDEGNAATFDVVTQVLIPPFDMPMWMIINFEAQNDAYPGYPLMKRGVFYGCSLIADQYGKVFVKSNFGRIHKVYSIWLVINPPKYQEYTMNIYRLKEENRIGDFHDKVENYDLLTIVVIRLGSKHHSELTGIFRLLNALFLDKMKPEDLGKLMKDEYQITVTPALEKGVKEMCNLSEGVYARGRNEERDATALDMLRDHLPLEMIMKYSRLTMEDRKSTRLNSSH